ncbi:MAG: histidine phosphatase family protein [Bacteroidales bacterium]|nr:histidine phosphatase family protein [Bacteroidales bacterium]
MSKQKQLFIVRHGKSSWKYESIDDIDRHLKEKGIHDAYKMAKRMKDKNIKPGLIISSPAARAYHTASIFARTLDYSPEDITIRSHFYPGKDNEIIDTIKELDDNVDSVMIFGHNPAFTDVANHFLSEQLDKLPTSGVAIISFNASSLKDIEKENVDQVEIDYPKKK